MKKEIHIFFTALMFFTRIPCPKWVNHDPTYLKKSARYFSLVGIIIGSISALVFYSTSFILPLEISVLLSMVTSVYTTGAFHEDGFADVCDGLGGGWTKEKILLIKIPIHYIPLAIISGHSLSRFIATTLIYTLPYVRDTEDSKAKPAAKDISLNIVIISGLFGIAPLFFFKSSILFLVIIPMYLSKLYLASKFKKWLGGQTGDCAGAVQQLSEVIFYLSLIALWTFI